jgi:hypothetical protein
LLLAEKFRIWGKILSTKLKAPRCRRASRFWERVFKSLVIRKFDMSKLIAALVAGLFAAGAFAQAAAPAAPAAKPAAPAAAAAPAAPAAAAAPAAPAAKAEMKKEDKAAMKSEKKVAKKAKKSKKAMANKA